VRHLAVVDASGAIVGVVDKDVLIGSPRYAPSVVLREIALAQGADDVARGCQRAVPLAIRLMDTTARPRLVNDMLTSVFDAATVRLVELAIAELGPAPAPFAFIAFGSQGRGEVHLTSDQDNGIVYAAPPEGVAGDDIGAWFGRLGERVSMGLHAAGFPLCRGAVMASEPKWRRSLPDWIATYDQWLRLANPQDITDLSIFLDFRWVYGDAGLVGELRRHVGATLPEQRGVLCLLARNALSFRPPLRLPGNIYLGGASESSGRLDLKDALQPIVAFARVYGARQRLAATHTLERITALADRGLLPEQSGAQITDAYDFLMGLRLRAQMTDIGEGREPSSVVELASLTHIQQELLRAAFAQIATVQKTAENEFPET
jgi:CBS domain-containing protein